MTGPPAARWKSIVRVAGFLASDELDGGAVPHRD
jgi:hypothetical protein